MKNKINNKYVIQDKPELNKLIGGIEPGELILITGEDEIAAWIYGAELVVNFIDQKIMTLNCCYDDLDVMKLPCFPLLLNNRKNYDKYVIDENKVKKITVKNIEDHIINDNVKVIVINRWDKTNMTPKADLSRLAYLCKKYKVVIICTCDNMKRKFARQLKRRLDTFNEHWTVSKTELEVVTNDKDDTGTIDLYLYHEYEVGCALVRMSDIYADVYMEECKDLFKTYVESGYAKPYKWMDRQADKIWNMFKYDKQRFDEIDEFMQDVIDDNASDYVGPGVNVVY